MLLTESGWPPETRIILSVLSGDPAKRNFSLLLCAVQEMARREPVALCVVGNVRWREEPAALALYEQGRFFHVPLTLNVEDYFAAADVFALPAHYEEFGMTVLEALASGCPCVVSRRTGARDVLTEGKDGFIFDDLASPGELMDKIQKALALKNAEADCRHKAEGFPWDRYAQSFAELYRELL